MKEESIVNPITSFFFSFSVSFFFFSVSLSYFQHKHWQYFPHIIVDEFEPMLSAGEVVVKVGKITYIENIYVDFLQYKTKIEIKKYIYKLWRIVIAASIIPLYIKKKMVLKTKNDISMQNYFIFSLSFPWLEAAGASGTCSGYKIKQTKKIIMVYASAILQQT